MFHRESSHLMLMLWPVRRKACLLHTSYVVKPGSRTHPVSLAHITMMIIELEFEAFFTYKSLHGQFKILQNSLQPHFNLPQA
jgi:hypothetical protein